MLICPGCQVAYDWTSDLDRCPVCASVHLVRRLGEVECRDCGSVRQSAAPALPGHLARAASVAGEPAGRPRQAASRSGGEVAGAGSGADGLAREVEAALARVLGRTAGSGASRG